jgi:hypothetical protein
MTYNAAVDRLYRRAEAVDRLRSPEWEKRADAMALVARITVGRFDDLAEAAEKLLDGTPEGFKAALKHMLGAELEPDEDDERPIVAVDLDGTLAEEDGPFDPDKVGDPRPGAAEWMHRLRDEGAYLVVHTVRGDEEVIAQWLDDHDVPWDSINESPRQPPGSSPKLYADVYLDNRAVAAEGSWDDFGPKVLARLHEEAPKGNNSGRD